MFTDGLDESAINWIKQGSDPVAQEPSIRSPLSPLTGKLSPNYERFPKSPINSLLKSPHLYNSSNFSSSHLLPPLKFSSGLLKPHSLVAPCLEDDDDSESVASVSGGNYSDEEETEVGLADFEYLENPVVQCYEEDEIFENRPKMRLNKGLLKEDLKIEVPGNLRRFTMDGDLEARNVSFKSLTTPASCPLRDRVQLRNAHAAFNGTSTNERSRFKEVEDLGTPSAPPIMETEREVNSFVHEPEVEQTSAEVLESRETESFDGSKDCSAEKISHPLPSTEFVERLNKTAAGEEETMPYWQTGSLDHSSYTTRL